MTPVGVSVTAYPDGPISQVSYSRGGSFVGRPFLGVPSMACDLGVRVLPESRS